MDQDLKSLPSLDHLSDFSHSGSILKFLNRKDPLYSFKFIQSKFKIDTKCYYFLAITLYPT